MEGVRLVHMDRDSLSLVDIHPLVRASIEASMLVAELFMAVSGYPLPCFTLRRKLVTRAAAAKARGSYAGAPLPPPRTPAERPRPAELRGGCGGDSGGGGVPAHPLPRPEPSYGSISFDAPGGGGVEPYSTARYAGGAVSVGSPSQVRRSSIDRA